MEYTTFRQHISEVIRLTARHFAQHHIGISAARQAIRTADAGKSKEDVNELLSRGFQCTVPEMLEKEDCGETADVEQFLKHMTNGALRKSPIEVQATAC